MRWAILRTKSYFDLKNKYKMIAHIEKQLIFPTSDNVTNLYY
jgi:hypothetical protein